MTTRIDILDRIRRGLGRAGPLDDAAARELEARLEAPRRNLVPARADLDRASQIALFVRMAEDAAGTVQRVENPTRLPRALASFLARYNLPKEVVMAPDPALARVPWETDSLLSVRRGVAGPGDEVSVTPAFAGIAETGTLMLLSGPGHPSTLNLLPDTHVVVLRESQIVGSYEDGWARLRRARARQMGQLPRTVLFLTGPSRSADIEQTLQMGAHGPRQLHILLVADGVAEEEQAP